MKLREIAGADTRHLEILHDHVSTYIGKLAAGKAQMRGRNAQDAFLGVIFALHYTTVAQQQINERGTARCQKNYGKSMR